MTTQPRRLQLVIMVNQICLRQTSRDGLSPDRAQGSLALIQNMHFKFLQVRQCPRMCSKQNQIPYGAERWKTSYHLAYNQDQDIGSSG